MTSQLSRRDFLRLAGLLSGSAAFSPFLQALPAAQQAAAGKKNVLIVVFDTLSAYHLSLYGYARETAPNIRRLAGRAIVYHNHFAACNWTGPSTASLFTGVLPWTHRAMNLFEPVVESLHNKNIFAAFSDYYRIAYSHNPAVYTLLDQFQSELNQYIPVKNLYLAYDSLPDSLFPNDADVARLGWGRSIRKGRSKGYAYSLFASEIYRRQRIRRTAHLAASFPRGIPNILDDQYFVLEHAIDFLGSQLTQVPEPFLAYFHFLPPHAPYNTHTEFLDRFRYDQFQPPRKPRDIFAVQPAHLPPSLPEPSKLTDQFVLELRRQYDEYILYVDREFARFFEHLEDSGLLENSWLILTSDHGELFERGILGHGGRTFFQPLIRIPLIIFEPGRRKGMDIAIPSSTVDLLPTLLKITGSQPAGWSDGTVLAPFLETSVDPAPNIFSVSTTVRAWDNEPPAPLEEGTLMLVKGRYKLTYFFGYPELGSGNERVSLYDIEADPEELNELSLRRPETAGELLRELKRRLAKAEEPYR